MRNKKRAAILSNECVACGCCAKSCPLEAISIYRGMHALIDGNKCVGCGKCEIVCPAQVISVVMEEVSPC